MLVWFGSCHAGNTKKGVNILWICPAGTRERWLQAKEHTTPCCSTTKLWFVVLWGWTSWRLSFMKLGNTNCQMDLLGSQLLTDGKIKMEKKIEMNWCLGQPKKTSIWVWQFNGTVRRTLQPGSVIAKWKMNRSPTEWIPQAWKNYLSTEVETKASQPRVCSLSLWNHKRRNEAN